VSRKANPTLIGAFVLGGVVLVVAALVLFGGGRYFTEKVTFVAFFDDAVTGLSIGAPVNFRGVKVGEVRDIQVHIAEALSLRIPVYLLLQPRRIRDVGIASPEPDIFAKLISEGLRARLEYSSYVTGQIQIELDFDSEPDRPPNYTNAATEFPEMPTVRSSLSEIRETLESLAFEDLVATAQQVLSGLNELVNSPDLAGSLSGLNQGIRDLQSLVTTANQQIEPLTTHVNRTLDEADHTLKDLQETLAVARGALVTAQDSLSIAGEESTLRYELRRTLDEISSAARSVRLLAEYLERNPDSLLRGKPGE
jgi:paraquat-inducible protein B